MANAVVPTSGTIVGVRRRRGRPRRSPGHRRRPDAGSAATLWFGGACYIAAGLLGTRLAKDLLGPFEAAGAAPAGARARARLAGRARRRLPRPGRRAQAPGRAARAAYALGAVGVHRALYGTLLVQALLLYRNYFYSGGNGNKALGSVTLLVITSAVGFGLAAVVTPQGVKRLTKDRVDRALAAHRRRGHHRARPDLRQVHVPGRRVRARPVRAVREDLRGHDRAADGGRRLHGPGVLAVRHAVQRRLRRRPGDRHPVPAGDGQVLRW